MSRTAVESPRRCVTGRTMDTGITKQKKGGKPDNSAVRTMRSAAKEIRKSEFLRLEGGYVLNSTESRNKNHS